MNFREAFTYKFGRAPTADDVLEFETNLRLLNTTPDDAMLAVMLLLKHDREQFSKIPTAINHAAEQAAKRVDDVAQKSFERAKSNLENDMHKAAAKAFSGLTEEARQAVISAGKDVAAAERAKAETELARENIDLRKKTIAAVALGSMLMLGLGGAIGFFSASSSSASQIAQLDAAAKAAEVRAVAAESSSAAAAESAADAATKKLSTELAQVRESARWAGTKEGILVSSCNVQGWRVESYTDGTKMCITSEAVKNLIGKDTPHTGFWLPTPKKK
jgi:hypothetical protein